MKLTKRLVSIFLICLISIVVASSIGGYLIRQHQIATSLQYILKAHYWQLAIGRYTLFALVIWYWPSLVHWLGKQWPAEVRSYFVRQRIRITLFFIMFEIFIVHNALSYLLDQVIGGIKYAISW